MDIRVNPAKFLPPTLRGDQVVARQRLLKRAAHRSNGRRYIFIEAQPGQGKTTFAHQLLNYLDRPFCWYRLEKEDDDPLYLASGLLECLSREFEGYDSSLPREILSSGGAEAFEIVRLTNVLLSPLKSCAKARKTILFDDCHLLDPQGLGSQLLYGFTRELPPPLDAVCLSRSVIFAQDPGFRREAAVFDNSFLSFTQEEASELFRDVFELSLAREEISKIVGATHGWAMGLVMAGTEMAENAEWPDSPLVFGSIEDYFNANVRDKTPGDRWRDMLVLALVDDFDGHLAQRLLKTEDASEFIGKLLNRNYFLRSLGTDTGNYEFHHLFLEFLREKAFRELDPGVRAGALGEAATWCLERGEYEKALIYSMRLGALDRTEEILKQVGGALHTANRLVTIHRVFSEISPEGYENRPFLSLFAGLALVSIDPYRATALLEKSAAGFGERGIALWEMNATAQALFCHMMVTFDFHRGRPHLERLKELMKAHLASLPPVARLFTCNAAALGFYYIEGDAKSAMEQAKRALAISRELGLPNVEAVALIGGILCMMAPDDLAYGRSLMDRARTLLADRRLSGLQKFTLHFLLTHYCFVLGHWINWRHFRREAHESAESFLISRGVAGAFFALEDAEYALVKGQWRKATESCLKVLDNSGPGGGKHIKSLALATLGLVKALEGDGQGAVEAVDESFVMRSEIGGDSFLTFQYLYAGAAHAALGDLENASANLEKALLMSDRFLGEFVKAAARMNLAYAYLMNGDEEGCALQAEKFLEHISRFPARNIVTLHPGILKVVALAVKRDLKPAPNLAVLRDIFGKSITADGEVVEAMRVFALGGLSISWGRKGLGMDDLTPVQRQFLAHLLCAPGFRMEKEALAVLLWPDGSRRKAIANFDMTLSRLRKAIDDLLDDKLSRHYLVVKNGVVGFDHCDVDVELFTAAAAKGLAPTEGQTAWDGANRLREAEFHWKGELFIGLEVPDDAYHRRDQLTSLYREVVETLVVRYNELGLAREAERTLRKALLSMPADGRVNQLLSMLLTAEQDITGAKAVEEAFTEALRKKGFTPQEIKEQLDGFWQ